MRRCRKREEDHFLSTRPFKKGERIHPQGGEEGSLETTTYLTQRKVETSLHPIPEKEKRLSYPPDDRVKKKASFPISDRGGGPEYLLIGHVKPEEKIAKGGGHELPFRIKEKKLIEEKKLGYKRRRR